MTNDHNQTFDSIVTLVKENYMSVVQAFGEQVDAKQTINEITGIMKKLFQQEIKKYGWTGKEQLPPVFGERVFHETFSELSQLIYAVYLQQNFMELNLDTPFELEDIHKEKQELENMYKEEKITLTGDAYISEMKRALHYHLFTMYTDLQDILLSEQHLQHIKPSAKYSEKELVAKLEQEMEEMSRIRNQMDELVNRIQSLDDRYM